MSRVAVVTGGGSGIGAATVARLRARGDRVAVFDTSPGTQDHRVDVTDPDAVAAAVEQVRSDLGPIGIVVNAAGMGAGGHLGGEQFLQTWQRTLDVNLNGPMHVVRACLTDLLASGTGRVVNIASTEAVTASRNTMPYSVSKHALLGFTRSLAVDYGRHGLTANAVCPGPTETGMTAAIPADSKERFAHRFVPVGRYARADEIAFVVSMLTEVDASYVNGAAILVDGGMTAQTR